MTIKKANLYIDGPNIYNRIHSLYENNGIIDPLEHKYKRLDYHSLFKSIVKEKTGYTINRICYFTAVVISEKNPNQKTRHENYIRSLKTQGIEVVEGKYKRVVNNEVVRFEEQLTDVNLASRMVYDCCSGDCDAAFLMSGDTDFIGAIKYAQKGNPCLNFHIITPPYGKAGDLKNIPARIKIDSLRKELLNKANVEELKIRASGR